MAAEGSAPAAAASAGHLYECLGKSSHVDPQLAGDVSSLNSLNDGQIKQVISFVIAFLQSPKAHDIVADAAAFAAEHGVSAKGIKDSVRGLVLVLRGAVKHSVAKEALLADLQHMGLSESHGKRLTSAWAATAVSLTEVAASGAFLMNELVDMQWKFVVTASSSEVDRIGSAAVQLSLTLDTGAGSTTNVVVELTLPQFYDFLADMEKAQAYVSTLAGAGSA